MLYLAQVLATPPRLPFIFLKAQTGLCACAAFFQQTRVPARACTFEVRACTPVFTAGTRACNYEVRACTPIFCSRYACL